MTAGTLNKDLATHEALMRNLSVKLDVISEVLPIGSQIVYVDYPLHFNVGDMLINIGAEAFFARMRYSVLGRYSIFDACQINWGDPSLNSLKSAFIDNLTKLPKNVAIVLHGGGNFGDIYPEFQRLRELVVEHFLDRRIVFLPQSLHFRNEVALEQSLFKLKQHQDLHCFFRDSESLALYSKVCSRGALAPDMAHALFDTKQFHRFRQLRNGLTDSQSREALVLARTDAEAIATGVSKSPGRVFDWPDLESALGTSLFRLARKMQYLGFGLSSPIPLRIWEGVRDRMIDRACQIFSSSGYLKTDRLHGMILACLLDLPVRIADNEYGKLGRYRKAWLNGSPLVKRVGE